MIIIRNSSERGLTEFDWLKSYHTFSFGDYYDPNFMGFGHLRVINEDYVQPSQGFGTHGHRDMEIITYVLQGAVEHKDSMGNGSTIRPGEIQKMSAGTGITHSEINPSNTEILHLLQIWIIPNKMNLQPSYEQKTIHNDNKNQLILIGSPDGKENSIGISQNVHLYVAYLTEDQTIHYVIKNNHYLWIQVVKGDLYFDGRLLSNGDGAGIHDESNIYLQGTKDLEFLLFDFEKNN